MNYKPIIIVAGEPNSIFFEIFFKVIKKKIKSPIILIGSEKLILNQAKILKKRINLNLINENDLIKIFLYFAIYPLSHDIRRQESIPKIDKIIADNNFLDIFIFFFIKGITEININPKKIRPIPKIANDEIDSLKNIIPQIGIKNTADPLANG